MAIKNIKKNIIRKASNLVPETFGDEVIAEINSDFKSTVDEEDKELKAIDKEVRDRNKKEKLALKDKFRSKKNITLESEIFEDQEEEKEEERRLRAIDLFETFDDEEDLAYEDEEIDEYENFVEGLLSDSNNSVDDDSTIKEENDRDDSEDSEYHFEETSSNDESEKVRTAEDNDDFESGLEESTEDQESDQEFGESETSEEFSNKIKYDLFKEFVEVYGVDKARRRLVMIDELDDEVNNVLDENFYKSFENGDIDYEKYSEMVKLLKKTNEDRVKRLREEKTKFSEQIDPKLLSSDSEIIKENKRLKEENRKLEEEKNKIIDRFEEREIKKAKKEAEMILDFNIDENFGRRTQSERPFSTVQNARRKQQNKKSPFVKSSYIDETSLETEDWDNDSNNKRLEDNSSIVNNRIIEESPIEKEDFANENTSEKEHTTQKEDFSSKSKKDNNGSSIVEENVTSEKIEKDNSPSQSQLEREADSNSSNEEKKDSVKSAPKKAPVKINHKKSNFSKNIYSNMFNNDD